MSIYLQFFFGGKPEFIISEFIIGEIADILRRKFGWENWQILEVIEELRRFTTLVTPKKKISVIKEDPADNRILKCALEGKANYIVSGDRQHLLPLKALKEIKIISINDF